jgi:hypothetical protein
MDTFDVFRLKPNGRVFWIGTANSLQTAHWIVKLHAVGPSEEFLVFNSYTNETTIVRAEAKHPARNAVRRDRLFSG